MMKPIFEGLTAKFRSACHILECFVWIQHSCQSEIDNLYFPRGQVLDHDVFGLQRKKAYVHNELIHLSLRPIKVLS